MINDFPVQEVEQLTTIDTTRTITKNMTVAFVSQDPGNCPVTGYKFEKVNLYKFDILKYPSENEIKLVASIDETTGVFTLKDVTKALKWHVWLSATGPDGMASGVSTIWNMMFHLFSPPPVIILAPRFKFTPNSGQLS